MTSRVAIARISAHETLLVQLGTASTAALALITVSNPSPANERLSGLSFSAVLLAVDAIITEASQPYHIEQNTKHEFQNPCNLYIAYVPKISKQK